MKATVDESQWEEAMQGIAFDLQEAFKDKLTKEHGKDTGTLQSGIRGKVSNDTIIISMPEYGQNLEFGTPPHDVNPDDLEGWISRKWLSEWKPSDKSFYSSKSVRREEVIARLAKTLANHIRKFGTKSFPFVRDTMNRDAEKIIERNFQSAFK